MIKHHMFRKRHSNLNIEELLTSLKTMKERIREWFKLRKPDLKKLEHNKFWKTMLKIQQNMRANILT